MTTPNESDGLTDEESADLTQRVERFRAAWSPDGSTDLLTSLPPPGARHRRAVLVHLVLTDMPRRAAAGLPFRVERYVNLFPNDLSTGAVPAPLLVTEYRLRHRYTDRPELSEYQRWFPGQFEAMAEELRREPLDPSGPPGASGLVEPTRVTSSIEPAGLANTRIDDLPRPPRRGGEPPPAGDVLPANAPYRLVRRLGAGAFGEVYEARAPGEIPVAVKRIMRPVNDPASRAEEQALEAIKRLSHPFLLKTNAYWILDDRLVIVMELADGSLADRIAFYQGKGFPGVPPEELIPLFEQAAEALDYLHTEKIAHRDVKPENVLLLKGYAKVADFGLARAQQNTMTVVGNTAGTPAYMAPEMWRQQVSLHSSDQYSLAATYVRARLGRALFTTNVWVDLANAHINDTPDLNPLPAPEQAVLLKALAKHPDGRYGSCLEFTKALRKAVLPPPEPPKQVVRERRLGPVLTTVGVACVVALAVASATVYYLRPEPQSAPPTAQAPEPPPDKQDAKSEKPLIDVPTGWTAEPGETHTIGDKRFPQKLTRKVGDETLVALLIRPTDVGHPPPFYVLENKITNHTFRQVWTDGMSDTRSKLYGFVWANPDLVKGRVDALADKHRPDAPVLGVTVPQAILVAHRLGGSLPTPRQWLKAIGAMEPEPRKLPAGGPLVEVAALNGLPKGVLSGLDLRPWLVKADYYSKRKQLANRHLALGREQPLPVGAEEGGGDRSCWNIRQLISNGEEWLGQTGPVHGNVPIAVEPPPDEYTSALRVGTDYSEPRVMGFGEIKTDRAFLITTVEPPAGFRIVLNVSQ